MSMQRGPKSVWIEPKRTSTVDVSRFITKPWEGSLATFNMLIYGEPGEGKTPLLGTIVEEPRLMPALLINCDNGSLSIRERETLKTIHLSVMASELSEEQAKPVSEWDALEHIYRWLISTEHDIKTVMLDGGSDLEQFCEMGCIAYGVEHKDINKSHDEELAELGDYRRIQQRMKRMYMRFRDIKTKDGRKVNFIATAHEGKLKDSTGAIMTQPLYLGKGTILVQSVFDTVARLSTEEAANKKEVKKLTFRIAGRARARARAKELGSHMDNPTMKMIADAIFGKLDS